MKTLHINPSLFIIAGFNPVTGFYEVLITSNDPAKGVTNTDTVKIAMGKLETEASDFCTLLQKFVDFIATLDNASDLTPEKLVDGMFPDRILLVN